MVSQNPSKSDIPAAVSGNDRGLLLEETLSAGGPGHDLAAWRHYRPFWRPVLAGTLFAISVFVLSWYLMLGCHVGITGNGILALGGGAAVWIWVTSCVAFFFGGLIANAVSAPRSSGWVTGAAIWGLSVPLALVIFTFVAQGAGVLGSLGLPHATMIQTNGGNGVSVGGGFGFIWAAFITVLCALVLSIVGGIAGCACQKDKEPSER
ncbi:MAG: hypothetical protein ABSH08_14315 [Tepidisphaeraceae bacterium]|jgi:hypothetical protein